jgi:hypothetical protein
MPATEQREDAMAETLRQIAARLLAAMMDENDAPEED